MTHERGTRIALAEDSALLREGLIRLFKDAGFHTVLAVADAQTLLSQLDTTHTDLVVLDVRMPPTFRDEGVQAARYLRATCPGLPVMLLSQYVETSYLDELLAHGARGVGYLLKDRVAGLAELQHAVETLVGGGSVIDPHVVEQLMRRNKDPLARLTSREREVLSLMSQGYDNAQMSEHLWVTTGAIEKHITTIFAKLNLPADQPGHRRVQATLSWLQHAETG